MSIVVAFDFDQTLACTEVGYFEGLDTMVDRSFGGVERVKMIAEMLAELRDVANHEKLES